MNLKSVGIAIIVIGILMILFTQFNIVTNTEVIDTGTFKINRESNHPVQWPPVVGVILMVGGIALFFYGKKPKVTTPVPNKA